MKRYQKISLLIVIFFCIDYSIYTLLGFDLVYGRIKDQSLWHSLYAFVIGVCAFLSILLLKKED